MLRRARNPLASLLLIAVGVALALATGAFVVPGSDSPTTTVPIAAPEAPPTTAVAPPSTTMVAPTTTLPVPTTAPTTVPEPTETVAPPAPAPGAPLVPTRVRIDRIGVDASMIDLHKKADNTLEVPEDIHITGWYTGRSVPGEPGPSVVVGHVDSAAEGPGVFFRLDELVPGDLVEIERSDGSVATFRVTDSELVLKTQFPTEKVYGSVDGSKLRLVTCGGAFNAATHHYLGNVIVYADHVATTEAVTRRGDGWRS
jgi:sortase (surface protein transpeptidase)